jgi:hypothetical protein
MYAEYPEGMPVIAVQRSYTALLCDCIVERALSDPCIECTGGVNESDSLWRSRYAW